MTVLLLSYGVTLPPIPVASTSIDTSVPLPTDPARIFVGAPLPPPKTFPAIFELKIKTFAVPLPV